MLRVSEPLRRGEAIQSPRLCMVNRPALSATVHVAEVALRVSVSLRSGEAIQPHGFLEVLGHA
mgnify:CR=1 FL=1